MNEVLARILIFVGAIFMLLAAVGIIRMPDLLMRLQAAAKGSTLGAGFIFLGVAVHFAELSVISRALLIMVFLVLTAPIAAHMIGRAAYRVGVPLWAGSIVDDLKDKYDFEANLLKSPDATLQSAEAVREADRDDDKGGGVASP